MDNEVRRHNVHLWRWRERLILPLLKVYFSSNYFRVNDEWDASKENALLGAKFCA